MTASKSNTPIVMTIAGSDSGGGAGIQADIKAMSANGTYAASVITAITAQNTIGVSAVHPVPIDVVTAQIHSVLTDLDVKAIKIGMLFSSELVSAVVKALESFTGEVVVDPVMVAKSGDLLLQNEAVEALISELIPRATMLTPNYPEANVLLGIPSEAVNEDKHSLIEQGNQLLALGATSVLLKGGHGATNTCTDMLIDGTNEPLVLTAPRVNTRNTHGTGCTYSSSIAAYLAKGFSLRDAVTAAHTYLHAAIQGADELEIGKGHGPVHHFHNCWNIQ